MFNTRRMFLYLARVLGVFAPLTLLLGALGWLVLSPRLGIVTTSGRFLLALSTIIPAFLLIFAAFRVVGWFAASLYGLKSVGDGAKFAWRSVFKTFGFKPYLVYREGGEEILPDDPDFPLRRVGGPGNLLLYNDVAVVLERCGKISRVVRGPAAVPLQRFEKVYAHVDLRPQRWEYSVSAMTKDGIPVTCKADIGFQIADGGMPRTDKVVYPTTDDIVLRAATCTWIREHKRAEGVLNWAGRVVIGETEGTLRTLLARVRLDELVPAEPGSQVGAATRERIQNELRAELEKSVVKLGAKITHVFLGEIIVDQEVVRQWSDIWRTNWRKWATERIGLGKAERIQILEAARIEAQVDMLKHVAERFQAMAETGATVPSSAVALHFIEALRRTDQLTEWVRIYLAPQSWETLEKLRKLILPEKKEDGDGPGGLVPGTGPVR